MPRPKTITSSCTPTLGRASFAKFKPSGSEADRKLDEARTAIQSVQEALAHLSGYGG